MPEEKQPLKVFLCHAHSDADAVRALYEHLTADGIDAWLDKERLLPGQDWELEIRKAVREADVVIVCLSRQFSEKGFRQKEVRIALEEAALQPEGEIFIIPARLEECDVPESLKRWHWVELFETDGYEKLMRALQVRARSIGAELRAETRSGARIRKPIKTEYIVAIIGAVATIIAGILGSPLIEKWFTPAPSTTATSTLTDLPTTPSVALTTRTPAPTSTPTEFVATTVTPLPVEITDPKGVTMRLIPAGSFTMGSDDGDSDEKPPHQVELDGFYMDKDEVTNALYKDCVEAGKCSQPKSTSSYADSKYANHPVVYVDWNQAKAYCEWRGGNIPTEAQWEKAAQGTDERTYPWGEGIDCSKANYYDSSQSKFCVGDTAEVGSYESGVSSYGVYDMAGNVWEWVGDWYEANFYATLGDAALNPQGPSSGTSRVLRGGTWSYIENALRVSARSWNHPDYYNYNLGFRCVRSP